MKWLVILAILFAGCAERQRWTVEGEPYCFTKESIRSYSIALQMNNTEVLESLHDYGQCSLLQGGIKARHIMTTADGAVQIAIYTAGNRGSILWVLPKGIVVRR